MEMLLWGLLAVWLLGFVFMVGVHTSNGVFAHNPRSTLRILIADALWPLIVFAFGVQMLVEWLMEDTQ